jgi:multidrug efflux pump subunit AcrB
MAIAIIGGDIVSTMLTLFVVPRIYSIFTKIEGKAYFAQPREI